MSSHNAVLRTAANYFAITDSLEKNIVGIEAHVLRIDRYALGSELIELAEHDDVHVELGGGLARSGFHGFPIGVDRALGDHRDLARFTRPSAMPMKNSCICKCPTVGGGIARRRARWRFFARRTKSAMHWMHMSLSYRCMGWD
jgi:hypothetical protein